MKKGFTLVELSIVLVIIGLLIGGILVGQSLIKSAETQRSVKLFQSIKIGFDRFVEVYKEKPGDFSKRSTMFNPGYSNGNGDGLIAWGGSESRYFWYDLVQSTYFEAQTDLLTAPAYYFKYNNKNFNDGRLWAKTGTLYGGGWNGSSISSTEDFIGLANLANGTLLGSVLTGSEALALDKKLDDSLPFTGRIRGHRSRILTDYSTIQCSVDNSGVRNYIVSDEEDRCMMFFLINGY